jgi:hypothetical protein
MRDNLPAKNSAQKINKKRAGLASGSVMIRFIRLQLGVQKGDATNLGSLSEPRRKQNLYANPKRTAKLSLTLQSQTRFAKKGSNYF